MKPQKLNRDDIFYYAEVTYNTKPEYLWRKYPRYAVLRNPHSGKWYGILMDVPKMRLGLEGNGHADILNVKCAPMFIGPFLERQGFLPAYHMNKKNWISILLDGSVPEDEILHLLDLSFDLTESPLNTAQNYR